MAIGCTESDRKERKGKKIGRRSIDIGMSIELRPILLAWQEGSMPKRIGSREMMVQELDYMHNNPVKRGYVDDPLHWRYSSARNYSGQQGLVDVVTDWM